MSKATKLSPFEAVSLECMTVLGRDLSSAVELVYDPGAMGWARAHTSDLQLAPMYFSNARWLENFFQLSVISCLEILSSWLSDVVTCFRFVSLIRLNDVSSVDIKRCGFDLILFPSVSFQSTNIFVPITRLSSTWKIIMTIRSPWSCFKRTQGSTVEIFIPRRPIWPSEYVRYQWRPIFGISYNGRTTCPISVPFLAVPWYTGLFPSLSLIVYTIE